MLSSSPPSFTCSFIILFYWEGAPQYCWEFRSTFRNEQWTKNLGACPNNVVLGFIRVNLTVFKKHHAYLAVVGGHVMLQRGCSAWCMKTWTSSWVIYLTVPKFFKDAENREQCSSKFSTMMNIHQNFKKIILDSFYL